MVNIERGCLRQGGPKSCVSKYVPFRSSAPFVSPENVHNVHNVHPDACGSVSVRSWHGMPDVDLALSLEDCEERSGREDADTLVLSPVKEMAIAADEVVHLSLNRTLQVTIAGRIFLNDGRLRALIFLLQFLHHAKEPLPAFLPLLKLPERDHSGHRPPCPLDDVFIPLVVDLLEELTEILSGFEGVDLLDHFHTPFL